MSPGPTVRRALRFVASLLLAVLAVTGLSGGWQEFPQATTPGRILQTVAQLSYGLLSLPVLASGIWFRQRAHLVRSAWLGSLTAAGLLAPIVWIGASWLSGILAGAGAAIVGLVLLRMLRAGEAGASRSSTS